MPRFCLSFENDKAFKDVDGLELADDAAARDEAIGFGRDLMRLQPDRRDWSAYVVRVANDEGHDVLTLPFSEAG